MALAGLLNAKSDTLTSQMAQSAASGTLTSGNFGSPTGELYLVFDYDVAANYEVKKCTVAGTALSGCTHISGADVAHAAGSKVAWMMVAEYWTYINGKTTTLTDAASIAWDLSAGNIATVTLGGNRTLANPTQLAVGTYVLKVIQDGTGSRTLAYGNNFKWPSATAPTLSTAASAVDILTFICDGSSMYGVAAKGFA